MRIVNVRAVPPERTKRVTAIPDLRGGVLGLLDNSKPNADVIVTRLGERLREHFGLRDVLLREKPRPGSPAPEPVLRTLAEQCGAVIFASAD